MPEGAKADGRKTLDLRLWSLLICSPPLTFLLIDLLRFREQASCWFAMRVMVAQVLLEGKKFYVDIFDVTQPIVFELLKLALLPSQLLKACLSPLANLAGLQLSLAPDIFATFAVFAWLCGCFCLTYLIAKSALATADSDTREEVRTTILPCLLGAATASLIVRFDFGDLQHLFTMALLPWIYMRWLRYRGVEIPRGLALVVGIVTGITACFDLPYIFIVGLLEVALLLLMQRLKPLMNIELAAVAGVLPLYLIAVSMPDVYRQRYWEVVMPLRWLAFLQENILIYGPHSSTKRVDVLYSMCFVFILSLVFLKDKTLATCFTVLGLMGFALYVLEGDGLSHDLVLTIFAITVTGTLIPVEIGKRVANANIAKIKYLRLRQALKFLRKADSESLLLCASLIFTVAIAFGIHQNRALLTSVILKEKDYAKYTFENALKEFSQSRQTVSVMYNTPLAFPSMLVLDRRPSDYILYFDPILILDWAKTRNYITEPLSKFRQEIFVRLDVGIDLRRPDLIFVCDDYCRDLITQENIWPHLESNYEIVSNCRFNSGRWPPREYVGFNWNLNALKRRTTPP